MEKELYFGYNLIENNYGKYAVDFDLKGHSEYLENVNGVFEYNTIVNNYHQFRSYDLATTQTPTTYAVAIRGVQNITANRNIFDNTGGALRPQKLQYELVAGITSLGVENTLNVKENYWGTTNQYTIKKKIFDFDDWNNFAIAEFFPFLTVSNVHGTISTGQEVEIELDINHLGGRVWQDLALPARPEPYIVYSDLTVMPNVKFTLQQEPNYNSIRMSVFWFWENSSPWVCLSAE